MFTYVLIVMFTTPALFGSHVTTEQIGPFKNLFACEQAAVQVQRIAPVEVHTVCLNDDTQPPTWKGKPLKKPRQIPRKESK